MGRKIHQGPYRQLIPKLYMDSSQEISFARTISRLRLQMNLMINFKNCRIPKSAVIQVHVTMTRKEANDTATN